MDELDAVMATVQDTRECNGCSFEKYGDLVSSLAKTKRWWLPLTKLDRSPALERTAAHVYYQEEISPCVHPASRRTTPCAVHTENSADETVRSQRTLHFHP